MSGWWGRLQVAAAALCLPLWASAAAQPADVQQYLSDRRAAQRTVARAFAAAVQQGRDCAAKSAAPVALTAPGACGAGVDEAMAPVLALDRTRQAALFSSLRAMLGVQPWPGCEAEPVLNAETLMPELGFGMLDGLRYRCGPAADDAVVHTHRRLLDAWRAEPPASGEPPLPRARAAALAHPRFYGRALDAGAAFEVFQPLPVAAPPGASAAVALLGLWAQDVAPVPPSSVVATLLQGDRVLLVRLALAEPLPEMPACRAVFLHRERQSENSAFAAYMRCYTQALAGRPELAAVVAQAQARLNALAAAAP
ncbi:hypothetical protein [Roseateles sp. BYS87W]|uniref:Uncharacterized protein n=1 Tax=Pelomonas baiyunensis TaxID=3299026 RepID=A0ABW7GZ38_9BURK